MTKFYPTRNDLDSPDKLERTVKDIYDRIYHPSKTMPSKQDIKRVDINTGKTITKK
jgi:hypothetical protein